MKKVLLCFSSLVFCCGIFMGCQSSSVNTENASSATVASETMSLKETHSSIVENNKQIGEQVAKHTQQKMLKPNEQLVFEWENEYVIAGGSGIPFDDFALVQTCYPTMKVFKEIDEYTFVRGVITAEDNPTYARSKTLAKDVEIDKIKTVVLDLNKLLSVSLDYESTNGKLFFEVVRKGGAMDFPVDTKENTLLGNGCYLQEEKQLENTLLLWESEDMLYRLYGQKDTLLRLYSEAIYEQLLL